MKVLIAYESCTGNTGFAVEVVKRVLVRDGHEPSVARTRVTAPTEVPGYDLYCFATPIQSWAPLAPVWEFLRALPRLEGRPAFVLTTGGGWTGNCHRMMARELRRHGLLVIGDFRLTCPDNWPISRRYMGGALTGRLPRKKSVKRLVSFTREMAARAEDLNRGEPVELRAYRYLPTPTLPFGVFARRGGLSRGLGKRTVDEDLCDMCGSCVKACPVGAVTLEEYPRFGDSCVGCWACFNLCPREAIRTSIVKPEGYYPGLSKETRTALLRSAGLL